MKKTIVFSALILLSNSGQSAVLCSNSSVKKDNYSLIYVNGLSNSIDQAIARAKMLSMLNYPGLKGKIEFGYAYQQNEFIANQLIELVRQANFEAWDIVAKYIYNLKNAPPDIQASMIQLMAEIDRANYVVDSDLRKHINAYHAKISNSKKVILLPHSQGGYYANDARDNINRIYSGDADNIGIVAVGVPTTKISGNGLYTNMQNDVVVNTARTFNPSVLKANYLYSSPNDSLGHGFDETYMNIGYGNISPRARVIDHIVETASRLSGNPVVIRNDTIKISLDWSSPVDMDLHIYEPGGTHLSYKKLRGNAGRIDRDSLKGGAPEVYSVDCNNMLTGTYDIGVRFYSGSPGDKVEVDVNAGTANKVNKKRLYYSGNNSHIHDLGSVRVTGNKNSGYSFTIK